MPDPFVKNPCRYPDEVRARAPRGFRDQARRAAEVERLPVSEFIRRAIWRPRPKSWQTSKQLRLMRNAGRSATCRSPMRRSVASDAAELSAPLGRIDR